MAAERSDAEAEEAAEGIFSYSYISDGACALKSSPFPGLAESSSCSFVQLDTCPSQPWQHQHTRVFTSRATMAGLQSQTAASTGTAANPNKIGILIIFFFLLNQAGFWKSSDKF